MPTIQLDGHDIEISNPDRVYFPESGITKGEVVEYYRKIAPVMLPHLHDRPIAMRRFPRGIAGDSFFQKRFPKAFPRWIAHVDVINTYDEEVQFVVVQNAASLVYLANQAVLTFHAFTARMANIRLPDRMILDLDPNGATTFADIVAGARDTRAVLEARGLPSFVMTTGSKGLHVVVPIEPEVDIDDVRAFARSVAEELVAADPERFTIEQRKANRGDRIFVDYMRNGFAQTGVAPYSIRPIEGAPVATPVGWDELDDSDFGPQRWTIANVCGRTDQREDPWADIEGAAVHLPALER